MRKWSVIVVAVVVGGAVAFVAFDRLFGTHRMESWIGGVVVGIANSYLVPEISYESITYEAPGTVEMTDVAFTAPDGTRIIDIAQFTITLAELPKRGAPLKIKSVAIRNGDLNLIKDPEGGLKGLVPMLESKLSNTFQTKSGEKHKLSETLQLSEILIENVNLRFESDEGPPLILDGLHLQSKIAPDTGNDEGWYTVDIDFDRGEHFKIKIPGHINLNTLVVRVDDGSLHINLDEQTVTSLPPSLQAMLVKYEATGEMTVNFDGFLPLRNAQDGLVALDLELSDFNITSGDYMIPINSLLLKGGLSGGALGVTRLDMNALGGTVNAGANLPLSGEEPATAHWKLEQLDLEMLMSARVSEQESKLKGILDSNGEINSEETMDLESIDGSGTLKIRKGQLVRLPILKQLARVMNIVSFGELKPTHKLDLDFDFAPEGIKVTKLELVTPVLAARGNGLIDYQSNMDLVLNAGPLERLQASLGVVGDIFGKITDQLATYYVRGTFSEPTVSASLGPRRRASDNAEASEDAAPEGSAPPEDAPPPNDDGGGG